jgi:hypothetical protein
MAASLPLLIVSLLAANPSPGAAPRSRGPSNAERAKMGLLPRRVTPSRVTYLAEAARSRADRRAFPESGAPPVVLEAPVVAEAAAEVPGPAEAPVVAIAPSASTGAPALADAAPVPAASPIVGAEAPRAARVLPSQDEEPTPASPAAPAQVAAPARSPPPAVAPPAPAPAPAPEYATETVALVTQRFVDGEGRIVVRLLGPKARVLSERFDGDVRALPVRWAGRTEHGEIVELVEDAWGPIEVRRDPVGRFLSARAVEEGELE